MREAAWEDAIASFFVYSAQTDPKVSGSAPATTQDGLEGVSVSELLRRLLTLIESECPHRDDISCVSDSPLFSWPQWPTGGTSDDAQGSGEILEVMSTMQPARSGRMGDGELQLSTA